MSGRHPTLRNPFGVEVPPPQEVVGPADPPLGLLHCLPPLGLCPPSVEEWRLARGGAVAVRRVRAHTRERRGREGTSGNFTHDAESGVRDREEQPD